MSRAEALSAQVRSWLRRLSISSALDQGRPRGCPYEGDAVTGLARFVDIARGMWRAPPPHVCSCNNDPCPVCGGHGPSGEWSEGSEVSCDDCGAMLAVTNVVTCLGSSSFERIPEPCRNPEHGYDCELECATPTPEPANESA